MEKRELQKAKRELEARKCKKRKKRKCIDYPPSDFAHVLSQDERALGAEKKI
jgi:hypothetical protein